MGAFTTLGGYVIERTKLVRLLETAAELVCPNGLTGACCAAADAAEALGLIGDGKPFEDRSAVYSALGDSDLFNDFRPPLAQSLYWFAYNPRLTEAQRAGRFNYRRTALLLMAERVRGGE